MSFTAHLTAQFRMPIAIPAMASRGRPRKYNRRDADEICARLARGETLRAICRDDVMPPASTVMQWVEDDVDGFAERYARARDRGLEVLADEILEIADDSRNDWIETGDGPVMNKEAVLRSRLRVDTRKWLLSKLKPHRYGEKVQAELSGPNGGPIQQTTRVVIVPAKEAPTLAADTLARAEPGSGDA